MAQRQGHQSHASYRYMKGFRKARLHVQHEAMKSLNGEVKIIKPADRAKIAALRAGKVTG